jgi:hypothetical protein
MQARMDFGDDPDIAEMLRRKYLCLWTFSLTHSLNLLSAHNYRLPPAAFMKCVRSPIYAYGLGTCKMESEAADDIFLMRPQLGDKLHTRASSHFGGLIYRGSSENKNFSLMRLAGVRCVCLCSHIFTKNKEK